VKSTRIVATFVILFSFLSGSLLTGVPAKAATQTVNFADCQAAFNGQTINVALGDDLVITFTSCDTRVVDNLYLGPAPRTVSASVDIDGASFSRGLPLFDWRITGTAVGVGPLPAGTYIVFYWLGNAGTTPPRYDFEGSFTVIVGSIQPSGDVSFGTPTKPQTFELSLTPSDGAACSSSSQSGSGGTWVTLPGANDCTPSSAKNGARLLGWATTPDFPVAIAKRQVDNGWGAYETFNSDGQLSGVFIPAGGATFLSAAERLYTIWSD
jgi:hypothetical protein